MLSSGTLPLQSQLVGQEPTHTPLAFAFGEVEREVVDGLKAVSPASTN